MFMKICKKIGNYYRSKRVTFFGTVNRSEHG